jgi:hypothetical protein
MKGARQMPCGWRRGRQACVPVGVRGAQVGQWRRRASSSGEVWVRAATAAARRRPEWGGVVAVAQAVG